MLATADSAGNECNRKSERKRSTCSELGVAIFVEVSSSTCIEVESGGHWVFVGGEARWKEQARRTNGNITRGFKNTWLAVSCRMCCEWRC